MAFSICFFGSARYSQPLDTTSAKKFQALSALGRLYVVGFASTLRPQAFHEHATFYLMPQLPVRLLRYVLVFTLGPLLALWCIVRWRCQVIIAQGPHEGFAAAVAKHAARLLGYSVSLVVENHNDFEQDLFLQRRVSLPSVYRFLTAAMARYAFRHADAVRPVSDATREQLARWAPGTPHVQFMAWTDIDAFMKAGAHNNDVRAPTILYTGVLIPRKGVVYLVQAFAHIAHTYPDAQLVIIGRRENPEYADHLDKLVRQHGLEQRVRFLSQMPQIELAAWMSSARVFVLPSLSEALGRVIIEAMAAGTPVIGSRVDGIPEIVQDGTTGFLIEPENVQALAERLGWMLDHPAESYTMGQRAHAFAAQYFSTAAYVEGYRKLCHLATDRSQQQRGGADASSAV
jgi:glycosyltransferase involved in cell wall biosynthesis